MPRTYIDEILTKVTDPGKFQRVNSLTDQEARIVLSNYPSKEEFELLRDDAELNTIRLIYFRNLVDWASKEADVANKQVFDFVDSKTFVDYPDFLTDEKIIAAAKKQWIDDHSITFEELVREYETEILGARINQDGEVEVLILHNQVHFNAALDFNLNFSRIDHSLPPKVTIGFLCINSTVAPRGIGGEIYIMMKAPYTKKGRDYFVEAVIPQQIVSQEPDVAQ